MRLIGNDRSCRTGTAAGDMRPLLAELKLRSLDEETGSLLSCVGQLALQILDFGSEWCVTENSEAELCDHAWNTNGAEGLQHGITLRL